jgi:hypothetical protein
VGQHEVTLLVSDSLEDSELNSCVITVTEPYETTVKMQPRTMNLKSRRSKLTGRMEFPGQAMPELDREQPMLLLLGKTEIEAQEQTLVYSEEDNAWYLKGTFDFAAVIESLTKGIEHEITLVARVKTGQWIYGINAVKAK